MKQEKINSWAIALNKMPGDEGNGGDSGDSGSGANPN